MCVVSESVKINKFCQSGNDVILSCHRLTFYPNYVIYAPVITYFSLICDSVCMFQRQRLHCTSQPRDKSSIDLQYFFSKILCNFLCRVYCFFNCNVLCYSGLLQHSIFGCTVGTLIKHTHVSKTIRNLV